MHGRLPVEGATRRDPRTQAVVVDEGRCNGCGLCVLVCPYGAIEVDALSRKASKCDLCAGAVLRQALPAGSPEVRGCQRRRLLARKARARSLAMPLTYRKLKEFPIAKG